MNNRFSLPILQHEGFPVRRILGEIVTVTVVAAPMRFNMSREAEIIRHDLIGLDVVTYFDWKQVYQAVRDCFPVYPPGTRFAFLHEVYELFLASGKNEAASLVVRHIRPTSVAVPQLFPLREDQYVIINQ